MKLWLLRARDEELGTDPDENPWAPRYGAAFEFVIRVEDEESARKMAQDNAGSEAKLVAAVTVQFVEQICQVPASAATVRPVHRSEHQSGPPA